MYVYVFVDFIFTYKVKYSTLDDSNPVEELTFHVCERLSFSGENLHPENYGYRIVRVTLGKCCETIVNVIVIVIINFVPLDETDVLGDDHVYDGSNIYVMHMVFVNVYTY